MEQQAASLPRSVDRPDPRIAILEVLYGHIPIIALGNAVLSLANLAAYYSKLPVGSLFAYVAAIFVVISMRLLLFVYYRRFGLGHLSARHHLTLIQLSSLLNGLVWGGWSWYAVRHLSAADSLAMIVVQSGICAGVVSTSSASRLGLGLFVTAALLPLIIHEALYGGSDGLVVAGVMLLYLLLVMASSNRIYKTVYSSIELAHKNRLLAEKLYHSSNTDGLTGIANRRYLDHSLERMTNLYKRHALEFAVLLIDVDDFKLFNDSKGHLAGDECLKRIASTAQEVFTRKEDLVARFGGEEFVVLLPGLNSRKAVAVAEEFRQRVYDLNVRHESSRISSRVTVSIGLADTDAQHPLSPGRLLEFADQALYRAKREGKNCVCRIEVEAKQ